MARVTDSPPCDHLRPVTRYWDDTADRYLALFRDELLGKPYDRAVPDGFATALGRGARVCDAGCGPCGHVAAHLATRELRVFGIDISPRCVALVREFARALGAGGRLLIVAKEGRGEGWIDDPLGGGTEVFWAAFTQDELVPSLQGTGSPSSAATSVSRSPTRSPRAGSTSRR